MPQAAGRPASFDDMAHHGGAAVAGTDDNNDSR